MIFVFRHLEIQISIRIEEDLVHKRGELVLGCIEKHFCKHIFFNLCFCLKWFAPRHELVVTHHLNIISAYSTLTSLLAVAGQDSCAQAAAARVEDVPLQWAELQDCMWQNVDASCAPGGEQQNEQKPSQFRHHEKWAISEPFRMH